jgi:acyl-CoA thioesterase-1
MRCSEFARAGLVLLAVVLSGTVARAEETLIVLPLGDSITHGVPGDQGYRGFLREELAARSIRVQFIGTQKSPAGAHEGWSGFTADELLGRVDEALAGRAPDVVLLHIGTNDIGLGQKGERVAPEVTALLARIAQRAPKARVLLAQIIPMSRAGRGYEAEVQALNQRLIQVVKERQRTGQKVELVNLHDRLDTATDFHDMIHPNLDGYRKIARGWAAALTADSRKN